MSATEVCVWMCSVCLHHLYVCICVDVRAYTYVYMFGVSLCVCLFLHESSLSFGKPPDLLKPRIG